MSKRRKAGDWVFVCKGAGFGLSRGECAIIRPEPEGRDNDLCVLQCGDDDCQEWSTLWTENDPCSLCHVSECDMLDSEADAVRE